MTRVGLVGPRQLLPAQLGDLQGIVETKDVTWEDLAAALVVAAVTAVIAVALGRLVRRGLGRPATQQRAVAALVVRLVRWTVILIGGAWSLSFLGVSLGWLTLSVVLLLLIVGLILRPQIESLAASVVLTVRPAYGVGDEIEVLGQVGEVLEVTTRSTVLRRRDGRRLHVPNATMLAEAVTVSSTVQPRRTSIAFALDERTDLTHLERLVLGALDTVQGVAAEPHPALLARGIGGGVVRLELRFWHGSRIEEENRARDGAVRALRQALCGAGLRTATEEITVVLESAGDDVHDGRLRSD